MDRRILPIALLVCTSCADKRPVPEARTSAQPPDAGVLVVPPPAAVAPEPDAGDEEPVAAIRPTDVLSGAAAEQAIAELKGPTREPPPPDAPELRIYPAGVGPFELGMTRRDVAEQLGRRGRFTHVRTPPGEVSLEYADYLVTGGLIFMRMKIYGSRVSEIAVLGPDARARTDAGIGVGSTFEDALLAHGDPRRFGRGYVLSDLPGVIWVPADPSVLTMSNPPPLARVGSIIVVGPEAD